MLNIALLLILALIYTFQSLFAKLFSNQYTGEARFSSPVFSVIYGLFIGLLTLAMNGFSYEPSLWTFLFGLGNAVVLFLYNLALIEGSRRGPYSFLIICALSGAILVPMAFFGILGTEWITLIRGVGVLVMLVAFVLLNLKKESQKAKKSFYLWILLLFFVNGFYSVFLSLQARTMGGAERSEMLTTTFLFSGIISAVYLLCSSRKKFFSTFRMKPKAWIFALCSCIAATGAANLVLYMYSTDLTDTVINATHQGGILVFSVLVSMILFKEKMNWKQIVGSLIAVLAVVLLNV